MKNPKTIICEQRQPVRGRHLIVPVEFGGYHQGYNSMVQDIYEAACFYSMSKGARYCWRWLKRMRVFSKPIHDEPCAECEKWWELIPSKGDELLEIRNGF